MAARTSISVKVHSNKKGAGAKIANKAMKVAKSSMAKISSSKKKH